MAFQMPTFPLCTASLLPEAPTADVVLLELFQNLYGAPSGLNDTLAAVRRATRHAAAVAFVVWLKMPWHAAGNLRSLSQLRAEIGSTAAAWRADVVDVPRDQPSILRVQRRQLDRVVARGEAGELVPV